MVPGIYRKIKWLMIVRLIIATIILVVGSFFLRVEKIPFYFLISLVYIITIVYSIFLLKRSYLYLLAHSQIVFDIIIATFIIHYSGGLESVFAMLYVLSIISASVVISARASMVIASVASGLYALLVGMEYFGIIPQVSTGLGFYLDGFYCLYLVYVRVTMFCLVGFLSGLLAKRVTRMEERMRQGEKLSAMGEFAAGIAHQLRNPLASLSGSLELLKERLKLDEADQKLMELIVKESNRLGGIIDQFSDYTRAKNLKFERCNINETLSEVLALAKDSDRFSQNIEVVRSDEKEAINLAVDPQQIKQAFLNIILNAIEAMPEGGKLTIWIKDRIDHVEVRCSDTGVGITRDRLRKIFEPFQKTTKGRGAGIGLAIANRIVANHGGTISVKSKVGRGSTFTIRLPKYR